MTEGSVSKKLALKRLLDAGMLEEADALERYRSLDGSNRGWGGWLQDYYPDSAFVVWPESFAK